MTIKEAQEHLLEVVNGPKPGGPLDNSEPAATAVSLAIREATRVAAIGLLVWLDRLEAEDKAAHPPVPPILAEARRKAGLPDRIARGWVSPEDRY